MEVSTQQDSKNNSRRDFLKHSGLASGAALGAALALPSAAQAAPSCVLPAKWDSSVDVLVVGSGFAGLAAALEARVAGAEVTVIDKMSVFGGNSIINGGDFAAAGTPMQKEAGINDSPELMLKDMMKAGGYISHPQLAKMVADNSWDNLKWCMDFVGAKFTKVNFHGGHAVKRAHQTHNQSGSGLVNPMLAKCREIGVKLENRTKLVRLITDTTGRIVGAEVKKGYRFPDEKTGSTTFVQARRAVVMSSGGFSQDVPLRSIQDPRLDARFTSTNHPGATGEALLAACQAGAMDVQMDWIQLGPWTSPDEKGFGFVPQFTERVVGYGLMVDPATGKRFFKETGNRKERADAIIMLDHPAVILADSPTTLQQVHPAQMNGALENGALKKYDTLEDLARAYNMPVEVFVEQVKRWNGFVEKKQDTDLGCMIFPDAKPQITAPFYATRLWPRVHHTMGGLLINTKAQAIGFDLQPMKGLYACGEVTGGVHGAVRLGSVAMSDCVNFGRVAGRNAAADKA
jgi:flavocytochrome c